MVESLDNIMENKNLQILSDNNGLRYSDSPIVIHLCNTLCPIMRKLDVESAVVKLDGNLGVAFFFEVSERMIPAIREWSTKEAMAKIRHRGKEVAEWLDRKVISEARVMYGIHTKKTCDELIVFLPTKQAVDAFQDIDGLGKEIEEINISIELGVEEEHDHELC